VGSPLALPFADGSFEAVIFNGSFEALAGPDAGAARERHLQALAEASRVLAPGGCVYLGAENRRAFKALIEPVEPPARSPYTLSDYDDLFRGAGLGPPARFVSYPDHRTPEALLATVSEPALAYYLTAVREARPVQELPERVRRLELEALDEGRMTGFAGAYALVSRKASAC
jgi:SAM-dependent methyltransferase